LPNEKESDLNQGHQMGTIDMLITGGSFAACFFSRIGISYYPYITKKY
jgi:TRAP-type C4-dicarboxylate transport system substrate-binding protein